MSYSISVYGHIVPQESTGGETPQTPAEIEAELTVKLHELLSQPKYGCSGAQFGGSGIGTVGLLAAPVAKDAAPDRAGNGKG